MRKTTPIRFRTWAALLALFCAATLLVAAPPAGTPKFFKDDPLWKELRTQDASRASFYEPTLLYDLAENMFAQPGDKDFNRRAQNINTLDEVPDGDWFTNRAGLRPLTPEEVARGANAGKGPALGKWTVIAAKTDGVTPGFTIKDTSGKVWFIKFDPPGWRSMATGTEVVVAKLFWALGYHTTEYYIAKLRREDLAVDPSATFTPPSGKKRAMRGFDIDDLLKEAERDVDGTYRVIASLATPGKMIGRIRFYGTRADDPNDLVPHENHRELRGYGVFSAWFNHVDAKSINSLDALITENGRGFLRHYLLDFGSTLGSAATGPRDYWEGYEYLLEPYGQIARGMVSFGFYIQPWRKIEFYESHAIGRIPKDNTKWDPEAWRPRVANPAFIRARLDDKFWAARKAMAISDAMIRAAVEQGQFGDPGSEKFLAQALIERRDAILKRYLPAINPIVDPGLDSSGVLTFGNAALQARVAMPPEGYKAVWSNFDNATGQASRLGDTTAKEERMRAPELPSAEGAFVKVELSATSAKNPTWAQPVSAYFRHEAGGWKLVGFERLP